MAVSKANLLGLFVLFCSLGLGFANEVLEDPNAESEIMGHALPYRQDCCGFGRSCSIPCMPTNCVGSSNCCGDYGNPCGPNGCGCPQNPSIGCGVGSICQPCNPSPPCQWQGPCPSCSCVGPNEKFEAHHDSAQQADQAIHEEAMPPSN